MEEDPEDLIRQFKSKVEEAIRLLPEIPELHRKEVWTYWQIISVAVKAAVGGRGPFTAKQTASSRGRPRGRPRRQGQHSGSLSENCGKNQANNKAVGNKLNNVRKPGRKDKRQKQNLPDRKSKGDFLSQDQQSADFGETKRVHSNDKLSRASIGSTVISDRQSSFIADNANPMIYVLGSTGEPFSSVINNGSSAGSRGIASTLVQEPASILQIERSSSIVQNECLSQPDQTSVVELPQSFGKSGDDPSEILKAQVVDSFQPTSEPHNKHGNSSGKNIVIQTSHDTTKQTSEKMKKSNDGIPQRPETLVVSFHEIVQNKSAMDEAGSQILITLPNEMEVSATSVPKNSHNSENERLTSVIDSAVCQDKPASGSVSETVEKSSKENASAETHGNFLAKVAQPLIPSAIETSHSQTVETDMPPSHQGQCTKLACGSTNIINADVTLSTSSLETKLNSLPCGSVTTSVKRKRGRPRKYTADRQPQNLLSNGSLPSSIESHHSEKPLQISATVNNFEEKASEVDAVLQPPTKKQNNFTSTVTASDLKHKSKKTSHLEPAASTCATTVRRSERRTLPNRDEIFCYFAPSHRSKPEGEDAEGKEEVEKEEEDDSVDGEEESEEEERVGNARVENREVKTEEEKRKERTCPKCHVVLKSASSLSAHMRVHTGERPFSCPVCHKSFTTKGNCERHEVTHVGLKAFTCQQCNKKFTEKKSLKIHMRAHTGERPYECQICQMRFFQSGTLKTHMDRHTGHKGHLCDLCGKAFRQSCQLRVHMRRHKMHTPFQCQHCSKTFYTKSDMERHELRHTGERPFSCDQCSKTFTRMQYLREHQNTHLGRRPYRCLQCGMAFHTFASCHRHVSKHKMPDANDAAATTITTHYLDQQQQQQQQIHVEVAPDTPTHQVMEQVQVILDHQQLTNYHASNVQTFIIPDHQSFGHTTGVATTTTTITGSNPQSSAHAILSNLGLEVEESSEIYHVTLVDPGQGIALPVDQRVASNTMSTVADFSAINLLANATTQLSAPP